jgi:hypothetical protein
MRCKRIMDQFAGKGELYSFELKRAAGFGKDGEKNFEGTVTDLQMQTYLVIRDFRRRVNKKGLEYGWPVSVYSTPEALWGYDHIASAYSFDPAESRQKLRDHLKKHFPEANDLEIDVVLG